jgi:hypothetical protein
MPLALLRPPPPSPAAPASPPVLETDLDRILKLIPTELIAFYAATVPVLSDGRWYYLPVMLFLVGTVLAPLVLYLDGRNTGQAARWPQYVVRTLSFACWAIAVRWPFSPWLSSGTVSWLRSLAVLIVPFVGAVLLRERSLDYLAYPPLNRR